MTGISPLDIQQRQFRIKFRGFDIREVDAFLEQIADTIESMQTESTRLRDEIQRMASELKGHKEREESFKRAMLVSQQTIEQMKENAQKEAELIVADAEVRAEKILNRAHNRLAQLHEDMAELKRQRVQIEVQIRSVLETHSKLLDLGKEELRSLDEEDSKIKLLTK
ncbi:MAG: DivIVA domain-containing protein [Desulfobacterales bacterium]|jgi:cell division initiation protein|nr:DivIVA domain-containing protein [Desulfobacterales bacterium]